MSKFDTLRLSIAGIIRSPKSVLGTSSVSVFLPVKLAAYARLAEQRAAFLYQSSTVPIVASWAIFYIAFIVVYLPKNPLKVFYL